MNVNRYNFDSIVKKTKQAITPIPSGEEDAFYMPYLAAVEYRLYDYHLKQDIKGRHAQEILQLVLFDIKSAIGPEEYDCSKWIETYYLPCADAIEQLFLPEKNPNLKKSLRDDALENDRFFELARKVIVRIHESIGLWTKEHGPDGYFNFISGFIIKGVSVDQYLIDDEYFVQPQPKAGSRAISFFRK